MTQTIKLESFSNVELLENNLILNFDVILDEFIEQRLKDNENYSLLLVNTYTKGKKIKFLNRFQ